MSTTTSVTIPKSLADEVQKQVDRGEFNSQSAFVQSAIKTYLLFQKGGLSWEILATPFRSFAKKNNLRETDILNAVKEGRRSGKNTKSRK